MLRALLLQAFYSIRSERQLVEQLDYNLLFRWFVGLGMDTVRSCYCRPSMWWLNRLFRSRPERLMGGSWLRLAWGRCQL
jgi:hypothetical protein